MSLCFCPSLVDIEFSCSFLTAFKLEKFLEDIIRTCNAKSWITNVNLYDIVIQLLVGSFIFHKITCNLQHVFIWVCLSLVSCYLFLAVILPLDYSGWN